MKRVAIIGPGGNIGSHCTPHVGRMPDVASVLLVDPDVYEERNLASQDITRDDVGQPKALVQARRLRRINPALAVTAICDVVENVPLGLLRADVLLACLDSRAARRSVNAIARRLGIPWIDAGVRVEGLLARVNVFAPGPDQPCYECPFDERAYASLEQAYPCAGRVASAPTNAPSALGALAAALQALECEKLLAGQWDDLLVGKQVIVSATGHRHHVTRFAPNPACRCEHDAWAIEPVARGPEALTVAQAFELAGPSRVARALRLADQAFATRLVCATCGVTRDLSLHLLGRLDAAVRACPACAQPMRAAGFDLTEWLCAADLTAEVRAAPLASLGMLPGDVVTLAGEGPLVHVQIGGVP